MLVRIDVDQLRPGMFIHACTGSWLQNPFWRSRFLVTAPSQIERLKRAGIVELVIDDTKGSGVATTAAPCAAMPSAIAPAAAPPTPQSRPRAVPALMTEVDRARATVERSKAAVCRLFGEARLGHAVQVAEVAPLVDEIAASVARDPSAMLTVTRLKSKTEYTYLHSVAVCALMINLARHIGLPETQVRDIGMAGLLHDIGKMAMPTDVLEKPGGLDDGEYALIRRHPEEGHKLLVDSADINALALDVCLHHHERIDGRGYPFGLKAEEISLHARMGAICDVYDAITSNRPYKDAWPPSVALAKMLEWEGHFDPAVLDAFIASIGIPPLDALVRLRSNRLAIVTSSNAAVPTLPPVRAFYEIPEQRFTIYEDLSDAAAHARDPILKTERGDYWFGAQWPDVLAAVRSGAAPPIEAIGSAQPYVAVGRGWPRAANGD